MTIAQVRRHALSLPDTTEEPHFDFSSFRVRGRIFVTVPPGDEFIHVFLTDEERERALERAPDYMEELHWGKRILGVRVALLSANPKIVTELIAKAWQHKAAKGSAKKKPAARKKQKP